MPYWSGYSKLRLLLHAVVTSKYFDLCIAGVIGLNVITMALEFYMMPAVGRCADHTHAKHSQAVYSYHDKSLSGDEIPERDGTYHLICLLIYH